MALHTVKQAGLPLTAPPATLIHYLDTLSKRTFLSIGTSAPSDWQELINYTSIVPFPLITDFGKALIATGAGTASWQPTPNLDQRLKITQFDTTSDYLDSKLTVGTNLNKTIVNPGGDESLNLTLTTGNLTEDTSSVLTIGSGSGVVLGTGTTIQVKQSSALQSGYLSNTDWSTFNSKQNALTFGNLTGTSNRLGVTGGTGAVIGSGTSLDIDTGLLPSPLLTDTGKVLAATGANTAAWTDTATLDKLVRISIADTTSGYLNDKLTVGTNLNKTIVTPGGDETLNLTLTTGNLTEATSSILTISSGTGAVLGTGTSIQVKQSSALQSGYLSDTDWGTFNAKADYSFGANNFTGTGNFTTTTGTGTFNILRATTGIYDNASTPLVAIAPGTRWLYANDGTTVVLDWSSSSGISTAHQITSTLAIGTSPFAVTSTTLNTNLNADLLDGLHASAFQPADATLTSLAAIAGVSGDIIYANGTDSWTNLAANSLATKKYLQSFSSGIPSWQQIDYSEISNTPAQYWQRVGTVLSPTNAGDDVSTTGNFEIGGTNGVWASAVNGILTLTGKKSTSNNENLLLDFETVADEIGISSSTGVIDINIGTIQLKSTVTTGTSPFIIASTTLVTNLNADRWDGQNYPLTTLGDLMYGGAAGAATQLIGNTTITNKYLRSVGDGINPAAPTWQQIAYADISGTPTLPLTVTNGGTGRNTGSSAYGIVTTGTTATGVQQTITNNSNAGRWLATVSAVAIPTWANYSLPTYNAALTPNRLWYSSGTNQASEATNLTWDNNTLTALSTSAAQLNLSYDGSDYTTIQVGSTGICTLTNVGSVGDFVFSPFGTGTYTNVFSDVGKINFGGDLGTNNNTMLWDFETTPNTIGISSLSGATLLNFNALNLTTTGIGTFGVGRFTTSIKDNAGTPLIAIDTGNRLLYASDGTTVLLNWSSNSGLSTAKQITSTLAIGTSPLAVTSTTLNTNLNADLLDGQHAAAFQPINTTLTSLAAITSASGDIIYATGISAWTNLAANSTATKEYLQSVSSGTPSWQQIASADISNSIFVTSVGATAPIGSTGGLTPTISITSVDATHAGAVPLSGTPVTNTYLRATVTTGAVSWQQIAYADISGTPAIPYSASVTTALANYTVLITDSVIYANAASNNVEVDLPAATGSNRILTVKKIDSSSNTVTLKANGAELIDGQNTQVISFQWTSVTIQDAAAGVWYRI